MKLYFASPLFNPMERDFNFSLATRIRAGGVSVFLPQEDGALVPDLLSEGMSPEMAMSTVYATDIHAISKCDILLAVLDGRTIDEGVAFELGYAKALGKICVGLQTDFRRLLPVGNNPMITGGLDEVFYEAEELVSWLSQFVEAAD